MDMLDNLSHMGVYWSMKFGMYGVTVKGFGSLLDNLML
jgi:hypothetical protein